MKRPIALVLLLLVLHNAVGFYAFHALRQLEVKRGLARAIDGGALPDHALRVFKVPVVLYHQMDRRDFERAEGEFKHQGRFYEMVKRKLEKDTLYVYCYDNREKARLLDDLSRHTKTHLADVKGKPAGKQEKPVPSLLKEYLPLPENTLCLFPAAHVRVFAARRASLFASVPADIAAPPPKRA